MPKITVIIPTYNRAELLKQAVLSVFLQTFSDWELIIVNDCSQDNTREIVKKFNDPRIIYLENKKNRGVSFCCNLGIKKAAGEYVFILNDDDLMVSFALEKLIEKFKKSGLNNLGAVYGWAWYVSKKEKTFKVLTFKEKGNIFDKILAKHVFTNLLIKKEVFNSVGFYNENLASNEDFDFYLRLAQKYDFDFVQDILMIIRAHPKKHLSDFDRKHIKNHMEIIKKYSSGWPEKRFWLASFLPDSTYLSLSKIKHFIKLKKLANFKIRKKITLAKKELAKLKINKILIIHSGGIGDLITFTPVLRVLKQYFPWATIDVFTFFTPEAGEVLKRKELVKNIFKFKWSQKNWLKKIKIILQLRKRKYDLSIVPTDVNPLRGGIFSFLIGAKIRAGEIRKPEKKFFYTNTSLLNKNKKRAESNVDILKAIGLKVKHSLPEPFLDVGLEDKKFADNFWKENNIEDKFVVGFHPGCNVSQEFRRWPKEYFVELGKKIIKDLSGGQVLIFAGPEERELSLEIKKKLGKSAILADGYSLGEAAAIIGKCQFFIAGDSGMGHIASTTKTNLILIFGPSNYKRAAPQEKKNIYILKEKCSYPCDLISLRRYDKDRAHSCLKKITPDLVFNKILKIISKNAD